MKAQPIITAAQLLQPPPPAPQRIPAPAEYPEAPPSSSVAEGPSGGRIPSPRRLTTRDGYVDPKAWAELLRERGITP